LITRLITAWKEFNAPVNAAHLVFAALLVIPATVRYAGAATDFGLITACGPR
jgi:hypothetical protein